VTSLGRRLQKLEAAVEPQQWADRWFGLVPIALRKLSAADRDLLRSKSPWSEVSKQHPAVWERFDAALLEASQECGYNFPLRAMYLLL
jgi:hypothetical protein